MSFLTTAWVVLLKDLRAELRTREIVLTTVLFAVLVVLLAAFAFGLGTVPAGSAASVWAAMVSRCSASAAWASAVWVAWALSVITRKVGVAVASSAGPAASAGAAFRCCSRALAAKVSPITSSGSTPRA